MLYPKMDYYLFIKDMGVLEELHNALKTSLLIVYIQHYVLKIGILPKFKLNTCQHITFGFYGYSYLTLNVYYFAYVSHTSYTKDYTNLHAVYNIVA